MPRARAHAARDRPADARRQLRLRGARSARDRREIEPRPRRPPTASRRPPQAHLRTLEESVASKRDAVQQGASFLAIYSKTVELAQTRRGAPVACPVCEQPCDDAVVCRLVAKKAKLDSGDGAKELQAARDELKLLEADVSKPRTAQSTHAKWKQIKHGDLGALGSALTELRDEHAKIKQARLAVASCGESALHSNRAAGAQDLAAGRAELDALQRRDTEASELRADVDILKSHWEGYAKARQDAEQAAGMQSGIYTQARPKDQARPRRDLPAHNVPLTSANFSANCAGARRVGRGGRREDGAREEGRRARAEPPPPRAGNRDLGARSPPQCPSGDLPARSPGDLPAISTTSSRRWRACVVRSTRRRTSSRSSRPPSRRRRARCDDHAISTC